MAHRVQENEETGQITIGSETLTGWIDDVLCYSCGARRIDHDDPDAFFCPRCREWLEDACGDGGCRYCLGRPEEPLRDEGPD